MRKRIDDAFNQDRLAAVLVSVNSPGGSPVQSELISTYLKMKAKKEKVSLTMFVEDVAASGGYWIACAGHQVYASKTSIIGSLGVIMGTFGFEELQFRIFEQFLNPWIFYKINYEICLRYDSRIQ